MYIHSGDLYRTIGEGIIKYMRHHGLASVKGHRGESVCEEKKIERKRESAIERDSGARVGGIERVRGREIEML